VLYEPAQFERLTDEPWDPARVEDAIATIVADADAAFDPDALWAAHEWDGWEEPLPLKTLYVGAAGVIWALDALRRRGHAETSLDLANAALRPLELKRAEPDFTADEHYHPAALLAGETGPLLVAFRLASDPALADDLYVLVRANVANPTVDVMWGAPGTLLAALAMGEWTGEPRWAEAARESAAALRARRGDDGLWRQDDDYRGLGTLHGAAGNSLVLLRVEPDHALTASDDRADGRRADPGRRHAACLPGVRRGTGDDLPASPSAGATPTEAAADAGEGAVRSRAGGRPSRAAVAAVRRLLAGAGVGDAARRGPLPRQRAHDVSALGRERRGARAA
jgi:hypothetical protein